ncbi:Pca regulon regulatory protein [compost metagenome]
MDDQRDKQASPAGIEPISRALRVLEALNRRPLTTIADLHDDTGLPRPTLVRLLQALMVDGYVTQVSRTAGYRLAARVLALTSGYHPRDLLVDVAQPLMDRFTRQHKWPLYLATPEEMTMWVRYSTAPLTSIAPDHISGYAYRISLLVSALGKAYLASCPSAERRLLIAPLLGKPDSEDGQVRDQAAVDAMLREVRRKGYATTCSFLGDRGRGIAVPLREGRSVVGAISMRHFRSALSEAEVAKRFLGPLQDLSAEIGLELQGARKAQMSAATPREKTPANRKQK